MRFHKHRIHKDHRRFGAYAIIPGLRGDVNFTIHNPNVIPEELHMHKRQVDYFSVVKGKVLFRLLLKNGKEQKIILSENDHKTLIILPGVWHGYMALEPTILIFYISHKYDPNDEFRKKSDPESWKLHSKQRQRNITG